MEGDDEAHDERWLLLFTDLRGGADAGRRGEHTGRDIRTVSTSCSAQMPSVFANIEGTPCPAAEL